MTDTYTGPDRRREPEEVVPPFWFPTIRGFLTFSIVLLIVAIVMILMLHPPQVDERISNLLSGILGILIGCFKDVYGYNFNSTYETQVQNKTIADQARRGGTGAGTPLTVSQTIDAGPPASATATATADPQGQPVTATTTAASEPGPKSLP